LVYLTIFLTILGFRMYVVTPDDTRGSAMSKKQDQTVYKRADGKWINKRNDASRASGVHTTQRAAQDQAKSQLKKQGGSELTVKGVDGRIRSKDTIAPGRDPLDEGEILIGSTDQLGYGVTWKSFRVPPPISVTAKNGAQWSVRLHERAVDKINREVRLYPDRETGGILVGRLSEVTKTFNVVNVFPPPEDSRRASSEFVLGYRRGAA
jgi:hypothetical protein